jgi:hypothetical protein
MRKTVTSKKLNRTFALNTEAEEAAINAGIAADPDTFEVTAAQFKKMRGKPASSMDETTYLLQNPANAAHLMESIAQLKAGKVKAHKLVKMTANMQAGDLPIDESFENMPPVGRELV